MYFPFTSTRQRSRCLSVGWIFGSPFIPRSARAFRIRSAPIHLFSCPCLSFTGYELIIFVQRAGSCPAILTICTKKRVSDFVGGCIRVFGPNAEVEFFPGALVLNSHFIKVLNHITHPFCRGLAAQARQVFSAAF
mgnify:CR=1 FL=1